MKTSGMIMYEDESGLHEQIPQSDVKEIKGTLSSSEPQDRAHPWRRFFVPKGLIRAADGRPTSNGFPPARNDGK